MKHTMKTLIPVLALVLMLILSACGADTTSTVPEESEGSAESAAVQAADGKTLVVYFSATGTTRGVAEKIAAITGGDLYEIEAAQPYTEEDRNWHDDNSRTTHEQNDPSFRPEIGSELPSLEGYDTVYLGFPIWWGQEPRIMDPLVAPCDFDGITVIPCCTSGSSGIGSSGKNLEANAGSGTWLSGERFGGGVSEDELRAWIGSLH